MKNASENPLYGPLVQGRLNFLKRYAFCRRSPPHTLQVGGGDRRPEVSQKPWGPEKGKV